MTEPNADSDTQPVIPPAGDPQRAVAPQPEGPPSGEIALPSQPAADLERAGEPQPGEFSPAPETPPVWGRPAWQPPMEPTPGAWFEAAPAPVGVQPTTPEYRRGNGPAALVLVTALIAAILASGGTYLALSATGALDRAPVATTGTGSETTTPGTTRFDESSAIIDAAAKVSPAVVRITSTASVDTTDPNALPDTGVGSGVIFDAKGWILTNRHVVAGSGKLVVELKDGRTFDGTIYGIDTLTDLAIVKIDATGLPTAPIGDSGQIKVGQLAIAIGSPLGTYTNTVTSGIVSALGRSIQVQSGNLSNLIQTDTAINPGNSGGPLLDGGGNVIGIDTAVAANAQGIGFAIPINIAKPIMQQALAGEKLVRPWIGVRYQPVVPALIKDKHLTVDHGALVASGQDASGNAVPAVLPGSPADKAGVKDGDIITSIEGITVDTEHPLDAILTQFPPGRTVTLEVLRGGQTIKLQLTLGTRPANLN
jgi:S1-C subfamily serine protease